MTKVKIERSFVALLKKRLDESSPLVQVLLGPRQVGKTTGVEDQLIPKISAPTLYVSADEPLSPTAVWLTEQWQTALALGKGAILIVDEIQKVFDWSATIKRLWDRQRRSPKLKCVLLGSSSLAIQKGLTESLTGRYELIRAPHWGYIESQKAFGYDLETYLRFGGYPGGDPFVGDYSRWYSYIKHSVVDTVIGQDILSVHTVTKPALFRQCFELLCHYPAQEISYQKLLGQLQDRGNIDMVKYYLELFEGAYLFQSIFKYSARPLSTKSSSPKIIPLCPAFYTLANGPEALNDSEKRGHVFEAIVGAELLQLDEASVFYWRDGDHEVDFVVKIRGALFAIEVKSGRRRKKSGLALFKKQFPKAKCAFVTPDVYVDFAKNPLTFLETIAI